MLIDEVLDRFRSAGLVVDSLDTSGDLVRCPVDGDRRGKKSGWYICFKITTDSGKESYQGRFGNQSIDDKTLYFDTSDPAMSKDELRELRKSFLDRRRAEMDAKEEASREKVRRRAGQIWEGLPLSGASPYLSNKGVAGFGVRYTRGSVVVPVRRIADDVLTGLQFISAEGGKKFLTGTSKKGAGHLIGKIDPDCPLIVCEGYATGASLHMATEWPVLVAFDCGNLLPAAQAIRELRPDVQLIIAGDNDASSEDNPGKAAAIAAAQELGAIATVPDIESMPECLRPDFPKLDYNDMHLARGLDVISHQMTGVLNNPELNLAAASPAPPSEEESRANGEVISIDLEQVLNRYALIAGETKFWDCQERSEIKKTAFVELIGKSIYNEWKEHERRRMITRADVAAIQNGGEGGDLRILQRYVYIYPTKDAWDTERKDRIPLENLRAAMPNDYDWWLKHPQRRQVDSDRLVFDPTMTADPKTHINIFEGLPHKPSPKSEFWRCDAIRELIRWLCNDDVDVIDWVMKWLAYPIQNVGAKMDTALMFHSDVHGSGKSLLFADICRQLYGKYAAVLGQHQLESQYTDWRDRLLFAVFEEVLSRDQKYAHLGTIKHMITGKTQRIEKKFVSGWEEANHMNCIFLSNEFQPFPLEPSDRRFLVVWPRATLPEHLQQLVSNEMENGGIEAFYGYLLAYNTKGFNEHTKPLMTDDKARLIHFGLSGTELFYQAWRDGLLEAPYMSCITTDLYEVYKRWCSREGERSLTQTKFSLLLSVKEHKSRERFIEGTSISARQHMFFVVDEDGHDRSVSRQQWLGNCVVKFRQDSGLHRDDSF
ncbi:DUF5906 domain-containing protein [Hahella sp. HN01]|uniref:DUF5906 domain-containing protein n=1 Tax=Hahella sp. HN01 TaxID=2847262 RepID=UPI001C1F077C|nr:toprim domain-containing protein [Hahella sp. HN01]